MARFGTVQGLQTLVDLDERDPNGCSVSVRHDAVLSDGRQVVLLDDRGWTSSRWVDSETIDEVKRTARMVVGPDEPPSGRTRAEMEANHWATLEWKLENAGIRADGVELKALPHEVVLSDRLSALARKFGDVFFGLAARATGLSSWLATRSRSPRVNFHSNGLAICCQRRPNASSRCSSAARSVKSLRVRT